MLSLQIDAQGVVSALLRPEPPCLGLCEPEPAQLHRLEEGSWNEVPDSGWARDIAVGGSVVWAVGDDGAVASSTDGGPWSLLDAGVDDDLDAVVAVSEDELWVRSGFSSYLHWQGEMRQVASFTGSSVWDVAVDSAGSPWWLTRSSGSDDMVARLERQDGPTRTLVAEVPEATRMAMVSADEAVVGGRLGDDDVADAAYRRVLER